MSGIRQNFTLPYPIVVKIVEKITGDEASTLASTCQFMEKLVYRQQITNLPMKLCRRIIEKATPNEVNDLAQTSQFMWNLTLEIRGRPVNVLSIDDESNTEAYYNEHNDTFCLAINAEEYEDMLEHLIVTDSLEIYSCKEFKPTLREALKLPVLKYTRFELIGCTISKEDLKHFLHADVTTFYTDNVRVKPSLKFTELLELLKNVDNMRIDIPNITTTTNLVNQALEWDRTKPIKSFTYMRLPKIFTTAACIDFIEKFGTTQSDFHLSFSNSNAGFHERYRTVVQKAIDEARISERSSKGLAGVEQWRCQPLEY